MIIDVKARNERIFIPEFGGNQKLDPQTQFKIKVKKLNQTIYSNRWSTMTNNNDNDIEISIDYIDRVKAHVIGFVNPPMLQITETEQKELTIDILLSDDYEVLFPIVEELHYFINDLYDEEDETETKK